MPGEAETREPRSGVAAVSPAELRAFGAEFTKTLRTRRKTVEQTAIALDVPVPEVARWAAGQDLPPDPEARSLDEYLTARGAIQNLVIELRSKPDRAGRQLVPVPPPSQ